MIHRYAVPVHTDDAQTSPAVSETSLVTACIPLSSSQVLKRSVHNLYWTERLENVEELSRGGTTQELPLSLIHI